MEQRRQHTTAVHLLLFARLRLEQRVLQHSLECNCLFRQRTRICRNHFSVCRKELLDILLQRLEVSVALIDNVAGSGIVEQRQQQVFQRDVLVLPRACFRNGKI
jgi:hypothetical protein